MPRSRIPDLDRQKLALANAFRVACLSIHEKPLKAVSMHYQDIAHLPHPVSDPHVYHNTLERARINHNRSIGIPNPEVYHLSHFKSLNDYYAWHHAHHPHLSPSQSREEANRDVGVYQYEIEDKLSREKPNKPIDEQQVFKLLDRKLKNFVKPHKEAAPIPEQTMHPDAYPGWHQQSLYGMSHASRHLDKFLQYAKEDIAKGGAGHHFRDQILNQNIKHIGPREIGLAWHLLAPNKSELAYIDHATLDALGYKPDDYVPRDFPKYERELIAGRDAAGYDHTPLSMFQKGLLDSYYGPTSHETLAVDQPLRVEHADWTPQAAPHIWPSWWDETKPYREKVKKDWNESEGMANPPQTVMAALINRKNIGEDNVVFQIYKSGVRTKWNFKYQYPLPITSLEGLPIRISEFNNKLRISLPSPLWEAMGMSESFYDLNQERMLPAGIINQYITRLQVDPKLATIGPNVDNEVPDALANDSGDPMPMPSTNWSEDKPCQLCGGSKLVMMPDGPQACPSCSDWVDHQMFDDPSMPYIPPENPSGVHEEAPGTTGP